MPSASNVSVPNIQVQLIRAADLTPLAWKNGGGVTRQIAVYPDGATLDDFAWRISAAVVERAGPFSIFKGIDRFIVVTYGTSMILHGPEEPGSIMLRQGEVFAFEGEQAWVAELPDGPINDFNLMVRRGEGVGDLVVRKGGQRLDLDEGTAVLYCVRGAYGVHIRDGVARRLGPGDSLRVVVSAGCSEWLQVDDLSPDSMLIDARIRPA